MTDWRVVSGAVAGDNRGEVLQGAFTLQNMHTDPAAGITVELPGTVDRPVRGSGVFVPPGLGITVPPTAQTKRLPAEIRGLTGKDFFYLRN
jgi:hypothetical protein